MYRKDKAFVPSEGNVISTVFSKSVVSMIFGGITSFLGNIVDGLVIGREMETICMSSYQLVMPIISILAMVTIFFAAGIQNKYSEYLGAGRKKEAHAILSLTMTVTASIGILISLAMGFFSESLAYILGASEESGQLFTETVAYIRGLAPGITVVLLIPLISFLLYIEGRASTLFLAIGLMIVVNLAGDLASVFLFHSGMLGMGLASSLCYIVVFLVAVVTFIFKKPDFRFKLEGMSLSSLAPVVKMGLPSGIERFLLTLQVSFVNQLLIGISVEMVAIYSVLGILNMILQSIADGVATTTFTMASVFVGEEDGDSIKILLQVFVRKALMVGLSIMVIVFVLSPPLIGMFLGAKGEIMQTAGVSALRMFILYFPFYTIIRAYHKYIQAVGAIRLSLAIPFLEDALFFIPIAWFLVHGTGNMVWAAFAASEIITVTVILVVTFLQRKREEQFAFTKAFRRIPAALEQKNPNDYSVTLGADMQAVIHCNENVEHFLKENSAGSRVAYLVALAIEEMCGNIVKYNLGKADLSMDLRMISRKGYYVVRIRDNGRAFNPEQWSKIHESDDMAGNIGIRMVAGFADKFTYTNVLGMNNLVIRIGETEKHS